MTRLASQEREKLSAEELAVVLSHYDLGVVQEVRDFPRGSHKAAKLIVQTDRGSYLLKRRPATQSDTNRVAFAHDLQIYLRQKNFPLPHLIGTREDHSMVRYQNWAYEVFEFISGQAYDQSLVFTYEAGKTLGLYHSLVKDFQPRFTPPSGHYHHAPIIRQYLAELPVRMAEKTSARDHPADAAKLCQFLTGAYERAAESAEQQGLLEWEPQIVHSDWHPGNMLFAGKRVVAVIDYDAARIQPRVMDVANGVLQFSLVTGSRDPETWPEYTDEPRAKRFLRGYDEINLLSVAELLTIPALMQEALIAETVIPIWSTGVFAGIDGYRFLRMVARKVTWLRQKSGDLVKDIQES